MVNCKEKVTAKKMFLAKAQKRITAKKAVGFWLLAVGKKMSRRLRRLTQIFYLTAKDEKIYAKERNEKGFPI